MIHEEYDFKDLSNFLYDHNELLIAGMPRIEERTCFMTDLWNKRGKDILFFEILANNRLHYKFRDNEDGTIDISTELTGLLRHFKVYEKNIMIDLSSLDHILIMVITKQLLTKVVPKLLFASYIRPKKYSNRNKNNTNDKSFALCTQTSTVMAVPCFAKREKLKQTLCAFIGFEGIRLKKVLESEHNIECFLPIVAFPSGEPQWYNVTMLNNMDVIKSEIKQSAIRKCPSESIYEAINILENNTFPEDNIILAPLGTRPHSMACAIFACRHSNVGIHYDYAKEMENRTEGISKVIIYHLTHFLTV